MPANSQTPPTDGKPAKVNRPHEVPARNEYRGGELVVTFADITQRQLEKFRDEINSVDDKQRNPPRENRLAIRAAVRAGWFVDFALADNIGATDDPLLDWPPARVNWLARLISDKFLDVSYVDPT